MPSACGLAGIMNREGKAFSGEGIIRAMASMHERSNGLGGGFAGYGIYPDHNDDYAFHVLYETPEARKQTEPSLEENYHLVKEEPIPTRQIDAVQNPPLVWRYFLRPRMERRISSVETEEDFISR
jgi:glutamate synthase domain-containing protein 1